MKISSRGPLSPPASLLCKLGSIAVHAEEILSPGGHAADRFALQALFNDPEVKEWLKQMDSLAMIPRKR